MKTIFRFLLLVFSVFANMNPLLAQWVHVGLDTASVQAFAISDTNFFAVTKQ